MPSVALEWTASVSSATVASTGSTINAAGSSACQSTLITDVHALRRQTTEGSPRPDKLEVVAFFSIFSLRGQSFRESNAIKTVLPSF